MTNKKTREEIEIMKEGAHILKTVFTTIDAHVKEGVNAHYLDQLAYTVIKDHGAAPSFLGYQGFKHTTCISKNEEIVHGIPSEEKILYPGDICSIDCGVYYKGYHVDAARTFKIGKVDDEVEKLVQVTYDSFFKGIESVKAGDTMGCISNAIQTYAESEGFSVIRDLYSHGVGKELHEEPLIPNYGPKSAGPTLEVGMTLAIEPMLAIGKYNILTLDDKWTIITADRKWASHYENTICITETGVEVLTI